VGAAATISLRRLSPGGWCDAVWESSGQLAPRERGESLSVLLPVGFARPAILTAAGALLPHHFTLTARKRAAVCFCGTFLRVTPTGR